jgi:hypothetical protein
LSKPGHVDDTAIQLECLSCNGVIRWYTNDYSSHYFNPREENLVVPPPDRTWEVKADYDYSTGNKPVQNGDAVVIAVIEWGRLDTYGWGGLVLRQVSQSNYERIGLCYMDSRDVDSFVSRKAKLKDNFEWRYHRQFVASLPVRSFRII